MDFSIVIPSYNEMRNIKQNVLDSVYEYLKKQPYSWELVLSDDGSTDGTTQVLEQFAKSHKGVRVLANPHRGKGPTVLTALLDSKGEYCLFTDFDQATPLSELEKLLPFTTKGYDVVIGSREVAGAQRKKEPVHRHVMGRAFNFLVKIIAISGIEDTQCGFKLFSRAAIVKLCPKVVVYGGKGKRRDAFTGAFDVELLYLARKYKYTIAEVPVLWKYVQTKRVDPIKDSLRMLVDIIKIRFADLSGKYA